MVRSTDAPACAELLADKWNKISNELWADGKNSDELGLVLLLMHKAYHLGVVVPTKITTLSKWTRRIGNSRPELFKIYLRTKPRTVLQWYQEVGFGWGFVSVEVRQAICRGRWLWDRKKGCSRRNGGRILVLTCPFPAHCDVQGYRISKI